MWRDDYERFKRTMQGVGAQFPAKVVEGDPIDLIEVEGGQVFFELESSFITGAELEAVEENHWRTIIELCRHHGFSVLKCE